MRLTYLGKISDDGESPTLYATDRGTYVVQGWKIDDVEALATMKIPPHETAVEIPPGLLGFAPNED